MDRVFLLCVLVVVSVCSASKNVRHMEMDRTLDIDLEKQIEKSLLGPKIKVHLPF